MKTLLTSLYPYLRKYYLAFILGFVFIIISNFLGVYPAVIVRKAINNLVENPDMNQIIKYALLILALASLRAIFWFYVRQTIIVASRKIEADIRRDLFIKYLNFSFTTLKKLQTGDLMSRITEDLANIRMLLGPGIMYSLNMIVLFSFVIYNMLQVNVQFSLLVLSPLPILAILIYKVHNYVNILSREAQAQLSEITSIAQEAFSGIKVIKAYKKEPHIIKFFSKQSEEYFKRSMKLVKFYATFQPAMILLIGISSLFTIWVGGLNVINGTISYGNIAEFVIYINLLIWPVYALGWMSSIVELAIASQQRINALMNIKPEIIFKNDPVEPKNYDIKFKNVYFTYKNTGIQALKNISLKMESSKTYGITGKTGSGKTTLVQLILRLFDPDKGEITIGNINLRDFPEHQLYSLISYAPQEPFLFSTSILENLLYGNPDATEEDIEKVLKNVDLYEEVLNLPEGINTIIGERGVTLSGGQRQRLSLARALLKNAPILILDDVISALDTETAEKVINNIKKEKRTVIIISHRLDVFIHCNKIFVLHKGELVEVGTHQELLQKNGIYKLLWEA